MKVSFQHRLSTRLLFIIFTTIALLTVIISYNNYQSVRRVYFESYNDKTMLVNTTLASSISGGDIKAYIQLFRDDPKMQEMQLEAYAAREVLYERQNDGAPEDDPQLVEAQRTLNNFHSVMAKYKDSNYYNIQYKLNQLLLNSSAQYIYILADTGLPDMYTYIFDAFNPTQGRTLDRDDLGMPQYESDFEQSKEVLETGTAFTQAVYYSDDVYGALYYVYGPLKDANGTTVALIGTDVSAEEMHQLVQNMVMGNTVLAVIIGAVMLMIIYAYMNEVVIDPVKKMARATGALSRGELDAVFPDQLAQRKDEMGILASSTLAMVNNFKGMLSSTKGLFDSAIHGNLLARSDPGQFPGDYGTTLERFNDTLNVIDEYLDNLPEPIFIIEPNLRVLYQNRPFTKTFKTIDFVPELLHTAMGDESESREVLAHKIARAVVPGKFTSVCWLQPDGEETACFSVNLCPIHRDGKLSNILVVASDITDLMLEKENAQAANQAKSEFLSRISHELRTPLNAIIGMSNLGLRDAHDPAKATERYQNIVAASDHLLSLINDVLDMSRMEAGKTDIKQETLDFAALARETIEMMSISAEQKGLELRLDLEDGIPPHITGDKLKLRQVLVNLLSNSIKFTEEGFVRLAAGAAEAGEGGVLTITVSDTGIGMSQEFLGRIFKPFEQEEAFLARNHQGSGLGLSVSNGFIQLMGGSIAVNSELGKGTTFTISLPYTEAQAPPQAEDSEAADEQDISSLNFEGKHMLLADDIDINRLIVVEMLADTGISIDEAGDGEQALELFRASAPGHYDIVFMDIQMPRADGYETTKNIRALERPDAGTVPIIAMTANALTADIEKAEQNGMDGHISKPVDFDTCMRVLHKYLSKK